MKGVCRQPKNH